MRKIVITSLLAIFFTLTSGIQLQYAVQNAVSLRGSTSLNLEKPVKTEETKDGVTVKAEAEAVDEKGCVQKRHIW